MKPNAPRFRPSSPRPSRQPSAPIAAPPPATVGLAAQQPGSIATAKRIACDLYWSARTPREQRVAYLLMLLAGCPDGYASDADRAAAQQAHLERSTSQGA